MTTTNATSAAGLTANLSSITTTAQAKAAQAAASAQAGQAMGKDAFLKLFTTQLKNQNPLDPLNTNEFTANDLIKIQNYQYHNKQYPHP